MPEGDTVLRTARSLDRALAGERLERADLRWGERPGGTGLVGRVTLEVAARGKHLLHRVEGGLTLHTHLRMEGRWRIERSERVTPRVLADHRLRAVVGTARWTCLGLELGALDLVPTRDEHRLVGHLGPDVLGPDWDADAAAEAVLGAAGVPIAGALLDQRLVAGLGTVFASEALFLEGVHPWADAAGLGPDVVARVLARARRLMLLGCEQDVRSTTGRDGREERTWVHGRSGRPCRRCGDTVRVATVGRPPRERTIFSCPACQGGRAPTDDGRPQAPLGAERGARRRRR